MSRDLNSFLYWHPKLESIRAKQPRTICVGVSREALLNAHDELAEKPTDDLDELEALAPHREALYGAGRAIEYPLFLRTDQTSGKHDWRRTCFVPTEGALLHHVLCVAEFSECAQMPLGLPLEAMVLREYLAMESAFFAFNGMPVSRERRYFVRDGQVVCHHPYWPELVMQFYGKEPDGWREKLAALNKETTQEVELLTTYAIEISGRVRGAWSVDFCMAADGTWYFIDMALAKQSWHPECPEEAGLR